VEHIRLKSMTVDDDGGQGRGRVGLELRTAKALTYDVDVQRGTSTTNYEVINQPTGRKFLIRLTGPGLSCTQGTITGFETRLVPEDAPSNLLSIMPVPDAVLW